MGGFTHLEKQKNFFLYGFPNQICLVVCPGLHRSSRSVHNCPGLSILSTTMSATPTTTRKILVTKRPIFLKKSLHFRYLHVSDFVGHLVNLHVHHPFQFCKIGIKLLGQLKIISGA